VVQSIASCHHAAQHQECLFGRSCPHTDGSRTSIFRAAEVTSVLREAFVGMRRSNNDFEKTLAGAKAAE
jgi:hypothetical protein